MSDDLVARLRDLAAEGGTHHTWKHVRTVAREAAAALVLQSTARPIAYRVSYQHGVNGPEDIELYNVRGAAEQTREELTEAGKVNVVVTPLYAAPVLQSSARERRACDCQIPDPVMQADGKFYCYQCGFQTGARPAALPEVELAALRAAERTLTHTAYEWQQRAEAAEAAWERLEADYEAEIAERKRTQMALDLAEASRDALALKVRELEAQVIPINLERDAMLAYIHYVGFNYERFQAWHKAEMQVEP